MPGSAIQSSNPETSKKKSETPQNLTKLDHAITTTIKAYPNASKSQLANHIKDLGVTNHIQSVYNKLKKSDYLRREIGEIRDNNRQYLDRIIVPDALKVTQKAIKSKALTEKDKLPYVKLALDKSFGEIHRHEAPQQINIGNIERIQVAISQDLDVSSDDK